MKALKLLFLSVMVSLAFSSCDEYAGGEEANKALSYSFVKAVVNHDIDPADPVLPVDVYVTQTSNVDRTVMLTVVPEETTALDGDFTFTTSVVIPAGSLKGTSNMQFDLDNINVGDTRKVTFDIVLPEGAVLNNTTHKTTINYTPLCLDNLIEYTLTLDRYGSEISWEILQGATLIAEGGPYEDGATNALQAPMVFKYCLPSGSYTFKIYDAYGDGLYTSAAVQGSYRIKLGTTTLVQGTGNFGASKTHNFTL